MDILNILREEVKKVKLNCGTVIFPVFFFVMVVYLNVYLCRYEYKMKGWDDLVNTHTI